MNKKTMRTCIVVLSLILLTISTALNLRATQLSSLDPHRECLRWSTVKKYLPVTLGKVTRIKYMYDNNTLYAVIGSTKFIVAYIYGDDLGIVNNELWELLENYCYTNTYAHIKSTTSTYILLSALLAVISVTLAVISYKKLG